MSCVCKFCKWVTEKRNEVENSAPISIQDNVSTLQKELWLAEAKLEQIHRLAKRADALTGFVNVDDLYDVLERYNPKPPD